MADPTSRSICRLSETLVRSSTLRTCRSPSLLLASRFISFTSQRPQSLDLSGSERRRRRAEVSQNAVGRVVQPVGRLARNEDTVSGMHVSGFLIYGHLTMAIENEVDLLGRMAVDSLMSTRLDLNDGDRQVLRTGRA